MSDSNNIDDLFREHQDDWASKPKGTSWEKLTSRLDDKAVLQHRSKKTLVRWLGAACIVGLLGLGVGLINKSMNYNSEVATAHEVALPPVPTYDNSRISIDNIYDSTISEKVTSISNDIKANDKVRVRKEATPRKSNNTKDQKSEQVDSERNIGFITNETSERNSDDLSEGSEVPTTTYNWQSDVGLNKVPDNMPEVASGTIELEDEEIESNFDYKTTTAKDDKVKPASVNEELETITYKDDVVFANRASTTFKKEEYEALKEIETESQKAKKETSNKKEEKTKGDFDEKDQVLPAVALANDYNMILDKEAKLEALEQSQQKGAVSGESSSYGYETVEKTISITLPYDQHYCDTLWNPKNDSVVITINSTNFKIETCQVSNIGLLSKNKFLSNFYDKTIPEIRAVYESRIVYSDIYLCDTLPNYIQVPIIINYGIVDEPQQEKIIWRYDLNCPDNEMEKYITNFYKFVGG